jgi:hypothetical protein
MSNPDDDFQDFAVPYVKRARASARDKAGDAYNRARHPSSNVLVFNHSNDKN